MKLNKNGTCIRYLFYPNKKDLDPTPSPPPNKNVYIWQHSFYYKQ